MQPLQYYLIVLSLCSALKTLRMAIHTQLRKFRDIPVRDTRGSGHIADQLRALVLGGLVRPGEFLGTEDDLAKRFEVSRSVVREAVKGLEAVGLVEMKTGRGGGVSVASGNPSFFADALAIQLKLVGTSESELIDAQISVECAAAELAARFATEADLSHLEKLVRAAEESLKDLEECRRLSFEFHEALAVASKNRVLMSLLSSLRHVRDAARGAFPSAARAKAIVREHRELLELLKRGDAGAARANMEKHLGSFRARAREKAGEVKH